MKKFFIGVVIVITLLVAAFIGAYFYLEQQLKSGAVDQYIKETLSKELKVSFDYKSIHFNLENLMKFKPTLEIKGLEIANMPGFKQKKMLETEKIFLELYLKPLLSRKIEIRKIQIEKPHFILETNVLKQLNYEKWLALLANNPEPVPQLKFKANADSIAKASAKNKELKVEEIYLSEFALKLLSIENARLDFYDYTIAKPFSLTNMNMSLTDFHLSEENKVVADIAFNLTAFNSGKKNLNYKGQLGPIEASFKSLASNGNLKLELDIKDIPKEIRKQQFGNFFLAPNDSDRILLEANIEGDLLSDIHGSGSLDLNNINAGKSKKHHVNVKANVPISFTANLVQRQKISVNIKEAALNVSSDKAPRGLLKLNAKTDYNLLTSYVNGSVDGSLEAFDINALASSFSEFEDKIFGEFSVPSYSLNFAGANSNAIMKNLHGRGSLNIKDGKLYALDKIMEIKEKAKSLLEEATVEEVPLSEETKFSSISTNFYIESEKFHTDNVELITPLADLSGAGFFDFKQKLRYDMNLKVKDIPLKNMPLVPLKIRGTLERPSIKPDMSLIGQRVTQETAQELINEGLKHLNNFFQQMQAKQQKSSTTTSSSSPAEPAQAEPSTVEAAAETVESNAESEPAVSPEGTVD